MFSEIPGARPRYSLGREKKKDVLAYVSSFLRSLDVVTHKHVSLPKNRTNPL
jgi:hypothetical protein